LINLWLELPEEEKFETRVGFPTSPVQTIVENMARFVRGKNI